MRPAEEALDDLAAKVAAFEAGQPVELSATIRLADYLRWWLDVDLVDQVEDGLITATTRSSYVGPIEGHVKGPAAMISGRVAGLYWCRRTSYDAAQHETPRRTP